MKKLILALGLLWPMVGLADFATRGDAYKRGDFAAAMREWRPLAESGIAEAQYGLGIMYAYEDGLPKDNALAGKWYAFAAEQGLAAAHYNLG